jgi:hypothetical protein
LTAAMLSTWLIIVAFKTTALRANVTSDGS